MANEKRIFFIPSGDIQAIDQIGPQTKKRCDLAVKMAPHSKPDLFFCSGGYYLPPSIQTKPGAEIVAEYLESQGVPRQAIILDNESLDTWQNVQNLLNWLL